MADIELLGGEFSGHGHTALAPTAQQMTSSRQCCQPRKNASG